MPAPDLSSPRRVHVVGVGGSGMSAIATVLAAMGHTVTGSDATESAVLERLRAGGIDARAGHHPELLDGVDLVAVSTAIPKDDPEVVAARAAGIPVLRRAEALAALCSTRRTIAVGGTHGKTTTTAMLALALREAGLQPSFIVGGQVTGLGSGAAWGPGGWFVVEADESDGTFTELGAEVVVVTSVEPDHLDHHGSVDALQAAFARFVRDAPGPRIVCADDSAAAALASAVPCTTYGTAESAEYRVVDVASDRAGSSFTLVHDGETLGRISVPLPGLHNARNAAAAATTALAVGAPFEAAAKALAEFAGVGRRFEVRGGAGGVTFIDDYAHLPTEVAAAIAAARTGGYERVVCAFQPHRYTRTAALWRDFGVAFGDADIVAVTDIYPAGQQPLPGVTGKLIVDAVLDEAPWRRVAWLPRRDHLRSYLAATLRPGDLCLTLGAGDLTMLPDELLPLLA